MNDPRSSTTSSEPQTEAGAINDRLAQIFALQMQLQLRLNPGMFGGALEVGQLELGDDTFANDMFFEWLERHARAAMHECVELVDWTPWKWWSTQPGNKTNIPIGSAQHVHEMKLEVIDALHFLINCALMLGVTPEELFTLYVGKNKVNHERQDAGGY